jgi:cytidine deaminase
MTTDGLVLTARAAARNAYAPYSGYKIGCAVIFDGGFLTPYCGTNVENASYGLTICAERAAIFSGVSAGQRKLNVIAIACCDKDDKIIRCFRPCGACLQVIAEFANDSTVILLDGIGVFKLRDFMPAPFSLTASAVSSVSG